MQIFNHYSFCPVEYTPRPPAHAMSSTGDDTPSGRTALTPDSAAYEGPKGYHDVDRGPIAEKLARDAISVSDEILRETARLLELHAAANESVDQPHSLRLVKPKIILGNLTRQLKRENSGAEKYLEEFKNAKDDLEKSRAFTRLSCLNITFYDILWAVIKKQRGLIAALREVEVPVAHKPVKEGSKRNLTKVDAMVDNGAEWIKVITADPRRLVFQMTNAGWDWDVDEGEPGIEIVDHEDSGMEAIEMIRDLIAAASVSRAGRYHYRTPRVRILLPKITEGENGHVDALINIIRGLGKRHNITLTVQCGPEILAADPDEPPLEEILLRLLPREDFTFTPVLNLDCTILFNLGSDTAHFSPDSFESRHEARIKEDLDDERKNGPRLPKNIYPALSGRKLVCTEEVAVNFRNTVLDIGTETEVSRAKILIPEDNPSTDVSEAERKALLKEFQKLSVHPVPDDLQLPIQVVKTPTHDEVMALVEAGALPRMIPNLDENKFKSMNISAILQGWVHEQTTITSNRQVMNLLNQILDDPDNEDKKATNAFHVWMAPFGRRLAAKPKNS